MRNIFFIFILIIFQNYSTQDGTEHSDDFVEVVALNPQIKLDLRYATANNFLKRAVYPAARCYVRRLVAMRLDSVQRELETIGLGLKIFDGYRPLSVQKEMWKIMPDSRYVADPAKGSRHNRGAAVDVTLVDSLGNELEMPTPFDDFSEKASHDYMKVSAQARQNRWILKMIMQKFGFFPLKDEWWHYDYREWKNYEVSDVTFDDLKKQK